MSKSSPKAPAAPDPVATAGAQTASNKETAYWNAIMGNVNQTTPYGSITYSDSSNGVYDPNKAPTFSSNINLTPQAQSILDSQLRSQNALSQMGEDQLGRINSSVSTPYNYSGLPQVFGSDTDMATAQTKAEDAIYSRLDPEFSKDEEALRTRLINQGIGQGSEAYNNEMTQFNQAKNDARQQAVLGGQQYASALLNNSLTERNQAINEYNTQRNAPLNEYTALTSGTQIQNPSFASAGSGGAQSGDIQGATQNAYNAAMQQYNAKVGSQNATQGALFGLGGSFLSSPLAMSLFA